MATYAADRAQPLEFTTPKSPDGVATYRFDFSADLATGETISARAVTVETGITKDSDAIAASSTAVDVTLSAGTNGRRYKIECQVTTSAGHVYEITGVVKVAQR